VSSARSPRNLSPVIHLRPQTSEASWPSRIVAAGRFNSAHWNPLPASSNLNITMRRSTCGCPRKGYIPQNGGGTGVSLKKRARRLALSEVIWLCLILPARSPARRISFDPPISSIRVPVDRIVVQSPTGQLFAQCSRVLSYRISRGEFVREPALLLDLATDILVRAQNALRAIKLIPQYIQNQRSRAASRATRAAQSSTPARGT